MKKHLNVRPYRPTFVNELSDGDMDRRYESCRALLDTFSNAVCRSKVLFSDECAIYRSARDRYVVFYLIAAGFTVVFDVIGHVM